MRSEAEPEAPAVGRLDPARLSLELDGDDVRLTLPDGAVHPRIHALPAFPVTDPGGPVQLFAAKEDGGIGRPLGLIARLADLPPEQAERLEALIRRCRLQPRIVRILELRDEGAVLYWSVETDRGPHRFYTGRPRDAVQIEGPRLALKDLSGSRYHVADLAALDARSRALLDKAT